MTYHSLLMAGYSYGSLITTMLPPLAKLLEPLAAPELGSAAAEIRLRAQHLAQIQNHALTPPRLSSPSQTPGSPTTPDSSHRHFALRVGGDEAGALRRSKDFAHGRRSFSIDGDRLREGVDELLGKARLRKKGSTQSIRGAGDGRRSVSHSSAKSAMPPVTLGIEDSVLSGVQPAYLLISPLRGYIGHLAAVSFHPLLRWKHKSEDPEDLAERKLTENPTLAVYGDQDSLVNVTRLRDWTRRLTSTLQMTNFLPVEVSGAGHFWIEAGVADSLAAAVSRFAESLLSSGVIVPHKSGERDVSSRQLID